MIRRCASLAAISLVALACAAEPPVLAPPRFVRGALWWPARPPDAAPTAPGHPLAGGAWLEDRAWRPGEAIGGVAAPVRAECATLFSVPLGDVARAIAMGGEPPDTALAFSPEGDRLAIGSSLGEVLVVDAWNGRVLARRRLSEAVVKQVAWSTDGATLYAAEQSPDAFVVALDPGDLSTRASLRLADQVGSSPLPDDQDVYGVYALPAALSLDVLADGSLLVAASHGWVDAQGQRQNLARLLRLSADLRELGGWPDHAASMTLWNPRVRDGSVAVFVGRSAAGAPPPGLPIGGVQWLDAQTLGAEASFVPEVLRPHFDSTFLWDALDLRGPRVLAGWGDGRVFLLDRGGAVDQRWDTGVPVLESGVPIAATVGHGRLTDGLALFTTSGTSIPFGAAAPDARPPALHPAENTVWAKRWDGSEAWRYRGSERLQGLEVAPDGGWLVVGGGPRDTDAREDLFGAVVLATADDGRPPDERVLAVCPTEGPVFFRMALQADGRIAVAESPFRRPSGEVVGGYRVTVLR